MTVRKKKEQMLRMSATELMNITKAAMEGLEVRITRNVLDLVRDEIKPPQPGNKLEITEQKRVQPPQVVEFRQLTGGSVFRLEHGTQPIVKLEYQPNTWMTPTFEANAFYLKAGSTTKIPDSKRVVLLKASLAVSE